MGCILCVHILCYSHCSTVSNIMLYHTIWYLYRLYILHIQFFHFATVIYVYLPISFRFASQDMLPKSHNAPVPYPTMHHFVTEMCTYVHISVTKWCIVGCLSKGLWDFLDGSLAQGQSWDCSKESSLLTRLWLITELVRGYYWIGYHRAQQWPQDNFLLHLVWINKLN